ncbi:hypothetical protein V3C99_018479 [Haemonchus contortus]|uniref:Integrase catalytic domain-containing protein n=1 Tax=Haemonchus contortus TaxID=6289 RepID=A0A7I4Z1U8_HAECO
MDTGSTTFANQQTSQYPAIQLGKLVLEPFSGDITQFQRFWCAFEVAIHNDTTISPTYKFLYLQGLLKREAQIVLQDLDPDECNYYELVKALKKRYNRPHKTRAMLHKQLQQLPQAGHSGVDLRNTWFRISGILRGLRRYEGFRTVLPMLDLTRSKFPSDIQQKLHDVEFQYGTDLDLHQIMHHLDHIIASREKYEDTTTLKDSYSIHSSRRSRERSGSHAVRAITLNFWVNIVHEKNADDTVHVGTTLIGRADTTMIATGEITAHRRGTDIRLEVHLTTDAEAEAIPTPVPPSGNTPSVWIQYIAAIEDHLKAGFIEEVDERAVNTYRVYYIPHQAVYKKSSFTTKLRIVFDASSKVRGAVSLNDCIHQGPTLLPDLVGILLRIRLHRLLLIADVEKAFHQICLQRSQRDATRFLWLKDPYSPPSQGNLRIFRFTRIPFGISASPFMLAAAIRYYLRHFRSSLASEIERNTYVDNVALGAATTKQAVKKYFLAKSVFGDMHMNLRQFVCNSNLVNDTIATEDRVNAGSETMLLGIAWNYHQDTLRMAIKTIDVEVYSKRTALRALGSTYDPLGLLTPFLTNVKIFVQDL